ncbi:pentapeptide repeat-containing protein [Allorhizobium undicola]|uniref:pentapeptide repeat-containing protein n=1 Tax=Allorhizobium undicola TaxID=78527 RepID=UPI003D337701
MARVQSPAEDNRRSKVALMIGFAAFLLGLGILSLSTGPAMAGDCSTGPTAKVDWSECRKRQLMLGGSQLDNANLYDADLSATDLSNSSLRESNLEKATLIRASLANARAEGARFDRIEAYRAEMGRLAADGASFVAAEMQRVNLAGASLVTADFTKAELGRANFDKADISGARFRLANLSRAVLNNAVVKQPIAFEEAFMFRTRIEGVDLSSATGLEQDQINLACGDSRTRLPPGLNAPSNWPCPAD